MNYIRRFQETRVLDTMKAFPATYISGPRQAGKTTLVRDILADRFDGRYVTFDDIIERNAAMRNPGGFVSGLGDRATLDEVQMVPEVCRALKKEIDERRRGGVAGTAAGNTNGIFLLTGSASLRALPELADAMVGRMGAVTLLPLSAAEVAGNEANFVDQLFEGTFRSRESSAIPLSEMMTRASYPALLGMEDRDRDTWCRNLIQKITIEDPRHIYNLGKADRMPMLLQALAVRAGNLVNDAELSRDIGLNAVTTRAYRNLLEATFIAMELRPWHRNVGKRLVKAGKIQFHDTNLLCALLGQTHGILESTNPKLHGHVVQNFVGTELMKQTGHAQGDYKLGFYRTRDNREVDFTIERRDGRTVAIEVKHSENIAPSDLRGIEEFKSLCGESLAAAIVLCNAPRIIEYAEGIHLVPFEAMW